MPGYRVGGMRALLAIMLCAMFTGGCRQAPPPTDAVRQPVSPQSTRPSEDFATVWGVVIASESGLAWIPAEGPRQGESGPEAGGRSIEKRTSGSWYQAAISPDGRQVAFVAADLAVRCMDLVTGKVTQLAGAMDGPENARGPLVWAPDGSRVAFVDRGDIHVAGLDGFSRQVTTCGFVTDLGWAPDGTRLAFGRRDQDDKDLGLWMAGLDGGEPKQLIKGAGDVFAMGSPAWSPDGTVIACVRAWEGGALAFARPDGNARVDIGPAWGPLVWLADGSAVVYSAMEDEMTCRGVFKCSPEGDPEPVLEEQILAHDVLPDGALLVTQPAQAEDPGEDENASVIVRVIPQATAGGTETFRTTVDASYATCRWRPDGKAFAVYLERQEGAGAVLVAQVGEPLRPISASALALIGWARGVPPSGEATR